MLGLLRLEPPTPGPALPPARLTSLLAGRRIPRAAALALALVAWTPMACSVAWAQPDFAFGEAGALSPIRKVSAGLDSLSSDSLPHDPFGAVVAWIVKAAAGNRPAVLPESVVLHPIPGHDSYRYAVIGGQRLVVDAATRTVVYVVD